MTETAAKNGSATATRAADVVRNFLIALQEERYDDALALVDDDIVWINVSLSAVRGRQRLERCFGFAQRIQLGFRVHFHNVATEDGVVLTERTDAIVVGPVEHRFWVYGRFEVRDGRIAVWRDSFDWGDQTVGLLRGLAGAISPSLNRRWPGA